jgi:NAD(P)-dependent dehydrogenase (short-subunit alcohol dehydrogenase family)
MNLTGKVALVTGGTKGIGAATALKLARDGAHIAIVARDIGDDVIGKEISGLGVSCILLAADLSKEDECKRVVKETVEQLGGVDILVHSAGGPAMGSLLKGAREVWYSAFDIHVHAVFHLCAAAAPEMIKRNGGAIVLISSAAGLRGVKNAIAYATVKGALIQMTRALAFELSEHNIKVNCVSPGVIRTRFQNHLTPEQVANNINNRIPMKREGQPEDVAEVIEMLIKNEFITGENVVIDGGMTMRIV